MAVFGATTVQVSSSRLSSRDTSSQIVRATVRRQPEREPTVKPAALQRDVIAVPIVKLSRPSARLAS
jgi:hypothetical protein